MKKRILIWAVLLCFCLSGCGLSAGQKLAEQAAQEASTAAPVLEEAGDAQEATNQQPGEIPNTAAQAADIQMEDQTEEYRLAADAVSADIAALVLGPDIGPELDRIQTEYDALPQEAKDMVEGYDRLQQLRGDYDAAMEKVDDAIDAIDQIGEITHESMDDIEYAQDCYDRVDYDFQSAVTNADVLDGAMDACRQAIRDYGVAETQAMIDAGQYQEAMDYASQYITDHPEMGSQTEMTEIMQTAEVYWAYDLYNANYLEGTQMVLDDLRGDTVTDGLAWHVDNLQQKLNDWIAYIEPYNGRILSKTISGGYGELTVNSGSTALLIKVENYYDAGKYITFYVRANSSATINVPDGSYIVKYAGGDVYYGDGASMPFGENTRYTQADDTMEFETTYSGNYIYYDTITLTLYAVAGGNLSSYSIEPGQF